MAIDLTTPALLFPAISLLLLAYTNRFLAIANLIRGLHSEYKKDPNSIIVGQMKNLRLRISLIKNMQALGISSLFFCVLCMFVLFAGEVLIGKIIFAISLMLLMGSLAMSVYEIHISIIALKIQISDIELFKKEKGILEKIKGK